ncbi:hypothetical protein [Gelidibacter salicanalis]|uniref:Uncharacterized protein n=1 Tax=Gelidibacter salicanalis TaxID=291193 RepID=A0A934KQG8_9FLAO|nr:hypothetical protein [Gelidibacter salicanalis]MBJ7881959.1 hypothetical protein [Gelidibacter salicanalis]
MTKSESLIYLINSLTKAEKKSISSSMINSTSNFENLYHIILKKKNATADSVRKEYDTVCKGTSFETSVIYLHNFLLNSILDLRKNQDLNFLLFDNISKARILFEKSLYNECFKLLKKTKNTALKHENQYAFLLSSRLELDYLLSLNYPDIDENTLLKKQFKLNESLLTIQKTNQLSSLLELLKHRMVYIGNARTELQKNKLNDLVMSEMSIINSFTKENVEIDKLHQLFQANYLIDVGDFKSAQRSFYELNALMEKNKHLWSEPPIYYLFTLEGILDTLRSQRNYEGMAYFVEQLKKLKGSHQYFNLRIQCTIFLYELIPLLDNGDFVSSHNKMKLSAKDLLKNENLLSLSQNAELKLHISLIHFGLGEYKKAQKILNKIIFASRDYTQLPLYRTIRLVNLLILYEMKDFEFIKYESRTLNREIQMAKKSYKIEREIIKFVNKHNLPYLNSKRSKLWSEKEEKFKLISKDIYEKQTLKYFDFLIWIESKIKRVKLSHLLSEKRNANMTRS